MGFSLLALCMQPVFPISDAVLLTSAQEGSEAAFRALYERYWASLYSKACKRVEEEAAKDIIQDIMVSLWQRKAFVATDQNKSLASYLFTALKFRIIRYYSCTDSEIRNIENLDIPAGFSAEQEMESRELMELIESEIRNMPPRMQQIFRMSREEGTPIAAIATQLDISEQTVKNQISEALKRLRTGLREYDISEGFIVLAFFFWTGTP